MPKEQKISTGDKEGRAWVAGRHDRERVYLIYAPVAIQ